MTKKRKENSKNNKEVFFATENILGLEKMISKRSHSLFSSPKNEALTDFTVETKGQKIDQNVNSIINCFPKRIRFPQQPQNDELIIYGNGGNQAAKHKEETKLSRDPVSEELVDLEMSRIIKKFSGLKKFENFLFIFIEDVFSNEFFKIINWRKTKPKKDFKLTEDSYVLSDTEEEMQEESKKEKKKHQFHKKIQKNNKPKMKRKMKIKMKMNTKRKFQRNSFSSSQLDIERIKSKLQDRLRKGGRRSSSSNNVIKGKSMSASYGSFGSLLKKRKTGIFKEISKEKNQGFRRINSANSSISNSTNNVSMTRNSISFGQMMKKRPFSNSQKEVSIRMKLGKKPRKRTNNYFTSRKKNTKNTKKSYEKKRNSLPSLESLEAMYGSTNIVSTATVTAKGERKKGKGKRRNSGKKSFGNGRMKKRHSIGSSFETNRIKRSSKKLVFMETGVQERKKKILEKLNQLNTEKSKLLVRINWARKKKSMGLPGRDEFKSDYKKYVQVVHQMKAIQTKYNVKKRY